MEVCILRDSGFVFLFFGAELVSSGWPCLALALLVRSGCQCDGVSMLPFLFQVKPVDGDDDDDGGGGGGLVAVSMCVQCFVSSGCQAERFGPLVVLWFLILFAS